MLIRFKLPDGSSVTATRFTSVPKVDEIVQMTSGIYEVVRVVWNLEPDAYEDVRITLRRV